VKKWLAAGVVLLVLPVFLVVMTAALLTGTACGPRLQRRPARRPPDILGANIVGSDIVDCCVRCRLPRPRR